MNPLTILRIGAALYLLLFLFVVAVELAPLLWARLRRKAARIPPRKGQVWLSRRGVRYTIDGIDRDGDVCVSFDLKLSSGAVPLRTVESPSSWEHKMSAEELVLLEEKGNE